MKEKELIIKYAGKRFYDEGFHKISMDEIASGLRMSKKTIYKHFPTKDNLIESLIDYECEYHLIKEVAILGQKIGVIKMILQMIEFNLGDLSKYSEKWIQDLQNLKPELWDKYLQFKHNKHDTYFKKLMAQGRKEKLIKDIPLELILSGIESIVKNVLHSDFLVRNNLSINQALNYSIDILVSGILTEKGNKIYRKEKKLLKLFKK
ncbi:MAG: TetR/AcrR family transcriptional regulator [Ignavibacteriae bacterium]|nr:TetR/AcrR family transcriptional regulator [Ignavibacteriota bacterium]